MSEQVIEALEQKAGPFEPYIRALMRAGYTITPQEFLSGPRILLAALRESELLTYLHRAPHLQHIWRALQRPGLDQALVAWIEQPTSALPGGPHLSHALLTALESERGDIGTADMMWYHLLHALITYDADVNAILNSLNGATSPWPSSVSQTGDTGEHSAIHAPAPIRQEATVGLRYHDRHKEDVEQVVHHITQRGPEQVIVVRGMFGSARERLPQVLADILADPTSHEHGQRLAGYALVLVEDVGKLHAAAIHGNNVAADRLRRYIEQARSLRAILILSRGELLATDEPANGALLECLTDPDTVPIIISYEDATEDEARNPIKLRYINFRLVEMEPYRLEHTRNALRLYYGPYLAEDGMSLDPDAFKTFFELESAIYVQASGVTKRKVLPYSAADLLVEVIESMQQERNTPGLLRDKARNAEQRVNDRVIRQRDEGGKLLTAVTRLDAAIQRGIPDPVVAQDAQRVVDLWGPRWALINAIPSRMRGLAEQPGADVDADGLWVITDDMVTAQLMSEAAYHVLLWRSFKRSLLEFDPGVGDLITHG